VRIAEGESLPLVRRCSTHRSTGGLKGLRADVVILNEHAIDYLDEMQNLLTALVQELPGPGGWAEPGGMFLLRGRWDGGARIDDSSRQSLASFSSGTSEILCRNWNVRRRGSFASTTCLVPQNCERHSRLPHQCPCHLS
jgi:hypothetical protein